MINTQKHGCEVHHHVFRQMFDPVWVSILGRMEIVKRVHFSGDDTLGVYERGIDRTETPMPESGLERLPPSVQRVCGCRRNQFRCVLERVGRNIEPGNASRMEVRCLRVAQQYIIEERCESLRVMLRIF